MTQEDIDATKAPLLDHLIELRSRLIKAVVAFGLAFILCFFFARIWGLYGAAASLLISETVMNLYVVPACLRIAHDNVPDFLASLLQYPHSLRPAALLAQIRRSKPGFES